MHIDIRIELISFFSLDLTKNRNHERNTGTEESHLYSHNTYCRLQTVLIKTMELNKSWQEVASDCQTDESNGLISSLRDP